MTTKTERIELLPCPFCGSNKIEWGEEDWGGATYSYIGCEECGCRSNSYRQDENAIKTWNTRSLNNDPKDKNFLQGVAISLANLNRTHDQPTMVKDVLVGMNLTVEDLSAAGVEEYDLKELR